MLSILQWLWEDVFVYMCVCVCVCVRAGGRRCRKQAELLKEQRPTSNSHRLSVYERQNAKPAGQRIESEPCLATHTCTHTLFHTDTHSHSKHIVNTHTLWAMQQQPLPRGMGHVCVCGTDPDCNTTDYQSPADQCSPKHTQSHTCTHTHTHTHTHTQANTHTHTLAALTNLLSTTQRARPTRLTRYQYHPIAEELRQQFQSCSSKCGSMHHL